MRRLLTGVVVAALAVCALAARAEAQGQSGESPSPSPQTPARETPPSGDGAADVSITARVTARELRFEKVPNTSVEFPGKPKRETVWEAERQNLPPQVQPGVTYRDIGITLRITSVFADIDRIVAEALGEIPPSPDPSPAPEAAPPAPPRPQASTTPAPKPTRLASARRGGRRR